MEKLKDRLRKNGWTPDEIEHACSIIGHAKQNKHSHAQIMDRLIFFILLAIIVVLNFGLAFSFIPLLYFFSGWPLYFFVGIIAALFGWIIEGVIRSIEHLQSRHHVGLAVGMPLIAVTGIFFVLLGTNTAQGFGASSFTLLAVGLLYTVAFMSPYIVSRYVLKKEYYG